MFLTLFTESNCKATVSIIIIFFYTHAAHVQWHTHCLFTVFSVFFLHKLMLYYIMIMGSFLGSTPGTNSLVAVNSCTCEGYVQIYECRVTGYGATIWKGTALDCHSSTNEIVILPSDSVNRSITCNNGEIVGRLVRRENNSYVSQLSVSVSSEVIGGSIGCYHEVGVDALEIGTLRLATTTGM